MVSKTLLFLYILNNLAPAYLYSLKNRQTDIIIHITIAKLDRFYKEQKLLVILFLPQTIREWNQLDTSICQTSSASVFRKALLDFI